MSKTRQAVEAANARYRKQFGEKSRLTMPPVRRFAILTCMDARLDPAKFAGLSEGDAHVIRNAGGRASDDAIRSLVISYKLLGTREWFVVHHTDCGMATFDNPTMGELVSRGHQPAHHDGVAWHCEDDGHGSEEGRFIPWLTFSDAAEAVLEDVKRIRQHPMVPADIAIYGYLYHCESGELAPIPTAMAAGRARA
ncbi:beta-class carbonic anhydrase [Ferrimonas balearica]|uniref:beta-class carbonic anhydrase n=1 Tax=Ferrimonas balearica TaxID=44012 RepID=UPI001C989B6F|nr:carbonic anhydrase [Ferrimonas balearica]MBY6223540.1 carbonic anhydrase [Ferrimonas balearica]